MGLTFRDLDNDNGSGKKIQPDVIRTYSFNQAPIIRTHTESGFIGTGMLSWTNIAELFSGTPTGIQPYRGSGMVSGVQSTDIAFKTTDNWAGVDSGNTTVTIE